MFLRGKFVRNVKSILISSYDNEWMNEWTTRTLSHPLFCLLNFFSSFRGKIPFLDYISFKLVNFHEHILLAFSLQKKQSLKQYFFLSFKLGQDSSLTKQFICNSPGSYSIYVIFKILLKVRYLIHVYGFLDFLALVLKLLQ